MFKPNSSAEKLKDTGNGGNYILSSGMYPVRIIAVIERKATDSKSSSWDFFLDYNNQEQMFYRAIQMTNKDGSDNYQASLAHKLAAICNITSGIETVGEVLPVGKKDTNGKPTMEDCNIYAEFCDAEVILRVQMEYSLYDGKIMEKKIIRNIFRASDKASASEIINNVGNKESEDQANYFGRQYEIEDNKGHNAVYKDGLTEEQIKEWIASGRNKETTKTEAPKPRFSRTRM